MTDPTSRLVLEGVDRYRVVEPMFEGIRAILAYRGEPYSPAYIQGLSGAAFRVGGICPCAPTCACAMAPQDLLAQLGYSFEYLPLTAEGIDLARAVVPVIDRIKDEIRAGRPALVWHAFTYAEWDVVCGYDDREHLFFGRGSYAGLEDYASADQARTSTCISMAPALGALLIGERTAPLDARQAEVAALQEAVRHAHTPAGQDQPGAGWKMLYGLACYDRWINDLSDPAHQANTGERYCLIVFPSAHRAGADFVRELAPRYPAAAAHLEQAATHLAAEAEALGAGFQALFPNWEIPSAPDPAANEGAAAAVRRARDAYARGIDAIERALRQMA